MPSDYNASSIQHLTGLEGVRMRPSMYLGDMTNGEALHKLINEVVDNSVDEFMAGHCTHIEVTIHDDEGVTVTDNGRGIPVDWHEKSGMSALTLVLTQLHAGGKFGDQVSSGLHGIGVAAVNAVSTTFCVSVFRDGVVYEQAFEQGVPMTDVEQRPCSPRDRGTTIYFLRDPALFDEGNFRAGYDTQEVGDRLVELAFLNPGLRFTFIDHRWDYGKTHSFQYAGGLPDWLDKSLEGQKMVTPVIHFMDATARSTGGCEIAMAWTTSEGEEIKAYSNNTRNDGGGTHVTAFKTGLVKVLMNLAKESGMLRDVDLDITGADIRDGLHAILSVRGANLAYSSQTKNKLVTAYVKGMVDDLIDDQVEFWFHNNLPAVRVILGRAIQSAKRREAMRKAREKVDDAPALDGFSLPGKLADCQSKEPAECEVFLVEGDSAGGSSKQARDRKFQAILPLRGKVLNVERASLEAISNNAEIAAITAALGCGIEQQVFKLENLRYHKVVLMTDADVDGSHIRTLLLTFFWRCMPQLIHHGHIYIAQPPLYGVRHRDETYYFLDDNELNLFADTLSPIQLERMQVTRFKGLGEMNADALAATTMDPNNRTLLQVTVQDAVEAEKLFDMLMGDEVTDRRSFIEENATYARVDT